MTWGTTPVPPARGGGRSSADRQARPAGGRRGLRASATAVLRHHHPEASARPARREDRSCSIFRASRANGGKSGCRTRSWRRTWLRCPPPAERPGACADRCEQAGGSGGGRRRRGGQCLHSQVAGAGVHRQGFPHLAGDGYRGPDLVRSVATAAWIRGGVAAAVRATAERLHNTPAVARSAYIDPRVIELFERAGSPTAPFSRTAPSCSYWTEALLTEALPQRQHAAPGQVPGVRVTSGPSGQRRWGAGPAVRIQRVRHREGRLRRRSGLRLRGRGGVGPPRRGGSGFWRAGGVGPRRRRGLRLRGSGGVGLRGDAGVRGRSGPRLWGSGGVR